MFTRAVAAVGVEFMVVCVQGLVQSCGAAQAARGLPVIPC
jgi:hypothetical protein